ncbi:MAG: hypothetical protein L6Q84_17110 [Polyangiaceae bacterium]|nr:hypothetical protein [Polyangiaceae bacterium]
MNTQAETHPRSDTTEIAAAFLRVGAAWARHGLSIARSSVQTSARTLEVTADALGRIANRFQDLAEEPPKPGDDLVETTGKAD